MHTRIHLRALPIQHTHPPTTVELHRRRQTRNLLIILRRHIRKHSVLPRRDLLRQLHLFRKRRLALLDRTLEVHVLDLVAEIGVLLDDGDKAVLDLQVDFGAFFDVLG